MENKHLIPSDIIPQLDDDLFESLSGRINVEGIINYALYQIAMAKASRDENIYGELVEFIDIFISPYADEEYNNEIKDIKEEADTENTRIHPKQRKNLQSYMFYNYVDLKFKAIINLLARKGLLLDKEINQEV